VTSQRAGSGASGGSSWRLVFLLPFLFGLLRSLTSSPSPNHDYDVPSWQRPAPSVRPSSQHLTEPTGFSAAPRGIAGMPVVDTSFSSSEVCMRASMDACNAVRAVEGAMKRQDCTMAKSAMLALELAQTEAALNGTADAKRAVDNAVMLFKGYVSSCRSGSP
jgi:hypothetical protein